MESNAKKLVCPPCGVFLKEPYIYCCDCKSSTVLLCLSCFAKGREFQDHHNNHAYEIVRNNFSLLENQWTAEEELKLLDAILDCGIGNWSDVAKLMHTKNKDECRAHYLNYYVYNAKPPLPAVPEPPILTEICATPVVYKCAEDPPRPNQDSSLYNDMGGYMPARGDFNTEYDNFAELDIKYLDFSEEKDPLWKELQLCAAKVYQSRLRERARRKIAIRKYGLLNQQKVCQTWQRYLKIHKSNSIKFAKFERLLSQQGFDFFMEGLLNEHEARLRIIFLQECRSAGLTKLHSINTYLKLKKSREEHFQKRTALDEVLSHVKDDASCQQWIRRQVLKENSQGILEAPALGGSGRRAAPPLLILGLPDYEKLTKRERELCSTLRLIPQTFLDIKESLISECHKLGYLKLANARSTIKIDVNKTRKIYDLLLEERLINKDVT